MKNNQLFSLCFFVFLIALGSHVSAFSQPSLHSTSLMPSEQGVVKQIDHHHSEMLALLKKVVNINSGTMNFDGVQEVGQIFSQQLTDLGFETHWVDGKPFNRAGHLYASFEGAEASDRTKKLLLIGHLDTVFEKGSEFQAFKVLDESRVAGPGITDMKGGNVVIVSALKALKNAGSLDSMKIKVLLMGDEEKRGSPFHVATQKLVEAGHWADIALGFEDGDGDPKTAVISRRGATSWLLKVKGRPAHSSQIFRDGYGYGAIYETARILNSFREKLSSVPNLTFNPGSMVGGTKAEFDVATANGTAFGKNNVISETAIVYGDIRALSPDQLSEAKSVMRSIVNNNLAETEAEISFSAGYPPMSPSAGNKKLLAEYSAVSEAIGLGAVVAVDPRKAGAADISFVAEHVDMALDGLGLMGWGGHTVKEVADIGTLNSQSKRAALLMWRLSRH
jgi:glutamate carboxypeptidase